MTTEQSSKGLNRSRSTGATLPQTSLLSMKRYGDSTTPRMANPSNDQTPFPPITNNNTINNSSSSYNNDNANNIIDKNINHDIHVNVNKNALTSNQRLRAVSSFSPYNPPTTMAVRLSAGFGGIHSESKEGNVGACSPSPSLAAVAGPMGITVMDVATPHRPRLVLNYSSSVRDGANSDEGVRGIEGKDASYNNHVRENNAYYNYNNNSNNNNGGAGIATMAFQPCPSVLEIGRKGKSRDVPQCSSSILLATARGSNILIWDCSGRALSPLLGRLNAADAASFGEGNHATNSTARSSNDGYSARNELMGIEKHRGEDDVVMRHGNTRHSHHPRPPIDKSSGGIPPLLPSPMDLTAKSNAAATFDAVQSLATSTLSSSSTGAGVAAPTLSSSATPAASVTSNNTRPNNIHNNIPHKYDNHNSNLTSSPSVKGNVTSLAWKGPSAPILLSTSGTTACLWDLRVSLLSGVGNASGGNGSHARPCARFVSPNDIMPLGSNSYGYGGSELVHCAWSYDESLNQFATMDASGIVTVWDHRKSARPLAKFLAHEAGGVGIASLPPARECRERHGVGAEGRWVTWGVNGYDDGEDLVVKVYTESSTIPSGMNAEESTNDTVQAPDLSRNYRMTSKISMSGGVAARVHPSYPHGVLLLRTPALAARPTLNPNDFPSPIEVAIHPVTAAPRSIDLAGKRNAHGSSPNRRSSAPGPTTTTNTVDAVVSSPTLSPARLLSSSSPTSPPSLVIQDVDEMLEETRQYGGAGTPPMRGGWQAELWRIDPFQHDGAVDEGAITRDNSDGEDFGAVKVAEFRGGGPEEDALCIAPGRRGEDAEKVTAVDLCIGSSFGQLKAQGNKFSSGRMQHTEVTSSDGLVPELSLCCLMKNRFALYGIPEASVIAEPESNHPRHHRSKPTAEMEAKQAALVNAFSSHSSATKIYRQGYHLHRTSSWWNDSEDNVFGEDEPSRPSPIKRSQTGETEERGDTQFEIDLSSPNIFEGDDSAVGMPGTTEITENLGDKPDMEREETDGGVLVTNSSVDSAGEVQNISIQNIPIDPKKAAKVICPPLCGAIFSPGGVGGLVKFGNGPVKRMWSWYQSNQNTSPISPYSRTLREKILGDDGFEETDDASDEKKMNTSKEGTRGDNQKFPRTMFDLIEMSASAKIHQWGEENNENNTDNVSNEDSSSSSESSGTSSEGDSDRFYNDDETSGSDSESFYHVRRKNSASDDSDSFEGNMFDDYFAASRKSLLGPFPSSNVDDHSSANQKVGTRTLEDGGNERFAGLPSLSPNVVVTKRYDEIVLNGQLPELAQLLQLGDCWWLSDDFSVPDSNWNDNNIVSDSWGEWNETNSVQRNTSDPYLNSVSHKMTRDRSSSYDDSSKRLTMMGNLKKLFSYQIPGVAMTPPDQRLLISKNQTENNRLQSIINNSDLSERDASGDLKIGVYIRQNLPAPSAAPERLAVTRKLCLKNAQICSDLGQKSKADTWTLLAQTVEAIGELFLYISLSTLVLNSFNLLLLLHFILDVFDRDEYDGWGGEDDALTTGIVESILRYYESRGDYQMLCTILCVLTFGRDRRKNHRTNDSFSSYQLLPKFDDRRYDNYISRYAALLYSWGVLTVRSEISKRLAYGIPGGGAEIVMQLDPTRGNRNFRNGSFLPNPGVTPGLQFAAMCHQCMEPVVDTDICQRCKDYAFRCTICCSAVRGLCTWCPLCGHGGHVDHIMPWFQTNSVCPTGCGCVCIISS
ncbi:hypothetical protein ACHAXS_006526 [Conticribra weissflogii]